MSVDLGGTYRASIAVKDANGVPANATTVTLAITTPDQVVTTVAPVNPPAVTGLYIWDYQTAQSGLHEFDWATTAPGTAQTDYVNVRKFRALFSLAEARDYLAQGDTSRDQSIRWAMAAATRLTERIVGTCVIRTFTGEWAGGSYRDIIGLQHGPLPSETSVASVASVWAGGPSWVTADLAVNPEAAVIRLRSLLPFWFGPWKITYTGGRTEIPEDIISGCKEILWDLWATQRGNLTDQQEPGLAEVTAFEQGIPAGYVIPGRALQYLESERRPGFA